MEYGGDSHVGRHLNQVRDGTPPPTGVPSIATASAWDETYIVDLFDWYLHITERLDDYSGNAQWALKDFATPLRRQSDPVHQPEGVLDREGRPKEAYWVFKSYGLSPWRSAFCRIYGHTWAHRYGEANTPRTVRSIATRPSRDSSTTAPIYGVRKRDIARFPAADCSGTLRCAAQNSRSDWPTLTMRRLHRIDSQSTIAIGGNGPPCRHYADCSSAGGWVSAHRSARHRRGRTSSSRQQ